MNCITYDGVSLHVRDEGDKDGRVVMFSNSLGTDLRVWDAMLQYLPDGLRLVRYDSRGHGLSDCPPPPYTIDHLIDDAVIVIDALDLTDITFVGHSIGGLVGQGLAAREPDLLRGLVLMNTAAKISTHEFWTQRIEQLYAVGIPGLSDVVLARWFSEDFRHQEARLAPWRNMLTRTSLDGYAGSCAAIAGADFTKSTANLNLPILAIAGAGDISTPPEQMKKTAASCNADFQVVNHACHLPCIEQPAKTGELLSEFLDATEMPRIAATG